MFRIGSVSAERLADDCPNLTGRILNGKILFRGPGGGAALPLPRGDWVAYNGRMPDRSISIAMFAVVVAIAATPPAAAAPPPAAAPAAAPPPAAAPARRSSH